MALTSWAIVIATGKSQELTAGAETAFLGVGSRPVLAHVMEAFERCREIEGIVVAASRDRLDMVRALGQRYGCAKLRSVVLGSAQRRATLEAALKVLDETVGMVTIHDVCRPCITTAMITETVLAARRCGAAIVAAPIHEPVKVSARGTTVERTFREGSLWVAQSPQTFRLELLQQALAAAHKKRLTLEEESAAFELISSEVRLVDPKRLNLRIRTAEDLALAAQLLQ